MLTKRSRRGRLAWSTAHAVFAALALSACGGTVETPAETEFRFDRSTTLPSGSRLRGLVALDDGDVLLQNPPPEGFELRTELVRRRSDGTVAWTVPLLDGSAPRLLAAPGGDLYLEGSVVGAMTIGDAVLEAPIPGGRYLVRLAPDGAIRWAKIYATGPSVALTEAAVAEDGRGVVVGGTYAGSIALEGTTLLPTNPNDRPGYLVQLDGNGDLVSATSLGADAAVSSVALASDGSLFVAGTFRGVMSLGGTPLAGGNEGATFFGKLDPEGKLTWSRHFYGYATPAEFRPWGNGAAAILGGTYIDVGLGSWLNGTVVARFESDGSVPWARSLWSRATDGRPHCAVEPSGRLLTFRDGSPAVAQEPPPAEPQARNRDLVAIGRDGTLDGSRSFDVLGPYEEPYVAALDLSPDGAIVAGATVETLEGEGASTRTTIARLRLVSAP